jgi:hypothetical protein
VNKIFMLLFYLCLILTCKYDILSFYVIFNNCIYVCIHIFIYMQPYFRETLVMNKIVYHSINLYSVEKFNPNCQKVDYEVLS